MHHERTNHFFFFLVSTLHGIRWVHLGIDYLRVYLNIPTFFSLSL